MRYWRIIVEGKLRAIIDLYAVSAMSLERGKITLNVPGERIEYLVSSSLDPQEAFEQLISAWVATRGE